MSRRQVLLAAGAGLLAASTRSLGSPPEPLRGSPGSPIELPPLPWATNALVPFLSAETIEVHYGKHHRGYVENLKKLVAGSELQDATLEEIISQTAGSPDRRSLFNNAAQAWNHSFYWGSMKPRGGGSPNGRLAERVAASFGSPDHLKRELAAAATSQFGSGWAWLVVHGDRLEVTQTSNADTPIATGRRPLLTIDVWEHAYYLDYRNRRADYVSAWLENLVNWDFASKNLK